MTLPKTLEDANIVNRTSTLVDHESVHRRNVSHGNNGLRQPIRKHPVEPSSLRILLFAGTLVVFVIMNMISTVHEVGTLISPKRSHVPTWFATYGDTISNSTSNERDMASLHSNESSTIVDENLEATIDNAIGSFNIGEWTKTDSDRSPFSLSQPSPKEDIPIVHKKNSVPATCGIYYFYHVGKCGGTSIRKWQHSFSIRSPATPANRMSNHMSFPSNDLQHTKLFQHIDWYYISKDGKDRQWPRGLQEIEDIIFHNLSLPIFDTQSPLHDSNIITATPTQNIVADPTLHQEHEQRHHHNNRQPIQWLSIHQHHRTPGLRYMMPRIRRWKQHLSNTTGCTVLLTTVLRNPIDRVLSLLSYNKISEQNVPTYLTQQVEGQARYLLYNSCNPIPKQNTTNNIFGNNPQGTWRHRDDVIVDAFFSNPSDPLPPDWCDAPGNVTGFSLTKHRADTYRSYNKTIGRRRFLNSNKGDPIRKSPSSTTTPSNSSDRYEGRGSRKHEQDEVHEILSYLKEFDLIGSTETLDQFVHVSEELTGWDELFQRRPEATATVSSITTTTIAPSTGTTANGLDSPMSKKAPHLNKSKRLPYEFTEEMMELATAAMKTDQFVWDVIFSSRPYPINNVTVGNVKHRR